MLSDPSTADAIVNAWLRPRGGIARDISTRQVMHAAGRAVARWRVTTDRSTYDLVAMTDPLDHPSITVVAIEGGDVGVFSLPHDPLLPGLVHLDDPDRASALLSQPIRSVHRRRYRPLTRAVVELVHHDGTRTWVKVVRPTSAPSIVDVHRRCAAAVDGPLVSQAWPDLGIVHLTHVPGEDLRSRLRVEGAVLPPVDQVVDLPTGLARVVSPRSVRRSPPLDGMARNVLRLREVVDGLHHVRLDHLSARLQAVATIATTAPGPTIHGDLHSAQVMVDDGGVTGLVDLDDAGAGQPADDLARFVAHLISTTDRPDGRWARPWSRDLIAAVRTVVPDEALQPRVAAQLLSLALGPHRVHRPGWEARTLRRIDLADLWSQPAAVSDPWGST